MTVPEALGGRALDAVVRGLFELSWNAARSHIERGKIAVDGEVVTDPRAPVAAGSEVVFTPNARRPRPETDLPDGAIVFVDAHVVVVRKPAGISTIPYDESETGTLDVRVRAFLQKKFGERSRAGPERGQRPELGVVHRIDKETSGLVVFTRSWLGKESLAKQFRAHTVTRRYLAIVHGTPREGKIESHLVPDRGDGLRGSVEHNRLRNRDGAQRAVTHVSVVEELRGASLVSCRLETGRTHQIRVHLSEAGHPLVGERVYIRRFSGDPIAAPRLMLHATELGFAHPKDERPVHFEDPMPKDMNAVLSRLREK